MVFFTWNHHFSIVVDNHVLRTSLPFSRSRKFSLNSFVMKNSILLVHDCDWFLCIIFWNFLSSNQKKLFFSRMRNDKGSTKNVDVFKFIFCLETENTPFLLNYRFVSGELDHFNRWKYFCIINASKDIKEWFIFNLPANLRMSLPLNI